MLLKTVKITPAATRTHTTPMRAISGSISAPKLWKTARPTVSRPPAAKAWSSRQIGLGQAWGQVAAARYQVTCLRYYHNPLQSQTVSFMSSEGEAGACRGSRSNDTSTCYYSVHSTQPWQTSWYSKPKLTLEDCKKRCAAQAGCTGIEFKEEAGYCEVWKVPIEAVLDVPGYRCYQVRAAESAIVMP